MLGANPAVPISAVVEEGQAGRGPAPGRQGADLPVVGSGAGRVHADWYHRVGHEHLAAHAPCPIVIIH